MVDLHHHHHSDKAPTLHGHHLLVELIYCEDIIVLSEVLKEQWKPLESSFEALQVDKRNGFCYYCVAIILLYTKLSRSFD